MGIASKLHLGIKSALRGSGGGSQSSRKPVESPDSLRSIAYARIVDLVSEGEIVGFADPDNPMTCVFLNETPVANPDGSLNFHNIQIDSRVGTQSQDHLPDFDGVESELGVGAELRQGTPWVRSVTNLNVDALRVRISVPALQRQNQENGDILGHSVVIRIELQTDGGAFVPVMSDALTGKTTTKYERAYRIQLPPAETGWAVRVVRVSSNQDSATVQDTTTVESLTEIIEAKLRMPMSALVSSIFDAEQFGNIPSRAYLLKGRIIRVPSNYDPVTREYSGVWDGTFQSRYSNNPAWVFYDMATNDRYGLGHLVTPSLVDKWTLYRIGQYCDQLVPDGFGGSEPRFTCNLYLQRQEDALRVMQDLATVFRGIVYANGGIITPVGDMPEDPVYTYTPANVIDGTFTYSGSRRKVRHTVALVSWNDLSDFGRAKVEYVDDEGGIDRYGVQETSVIAIGCTSQAQARRWGRYLLATEVLEDDSVAFDVGMDGTIVAPGKIIEIADPLRSGKRNGGRIRTSTGSSVTVDVMSLIVQAGDELIVTLPDGSTERRDVQSVEGSTITVTMPFSANPVPHSVWAIDSDDTPVAQFRVLSVAERNDGNSLGFTLSAIKHVPGKFAYADTGEPLNPMPDKEVPGKDVPQPTGLIITQRDVATQNATTKMVNLAWDNMLGVVTFNVKWRQGQASWMEVGSVGYNNIDIPNVQPGPFEVQVVAINSVGDRSQPTFGGPYDITPVATPPGYVDDITDEQVALQQALDQEVYDRIAEDLRVASEAAADALLKANAARDEALAAVNALAAEVGEIVNAPLWDAGESYLAGWLVRWDDALYRALADTTGEQPDLFPAVWERIGEYASLGEAVAAALTLVTQTADDLAAQVTRIDAMFARFPTGTGTLASEAMVASEVALLATAIAAEASRIDAVVARLPAGTGLLASEAMVATEVLALVNADTVLGQRIDTVAVSVGQPSSVVRKGTFEDGELGLWEGDNSTNSLTGTHPSSTRVLRISGTAYEGTSAQAVPAKPGDIIDVSVDASTAGSSGPATMLIHWLNASGGNAGFSTVLTIAGGQSSWQMGLSGTTSPAPAGTVAARVGLTRGTSGFALFTNIRGVIRTDAVQANAATLVQQQAQITTIDGQLTSVAEQLLLVQARMPGGNGALATNAQVVAVQSALADDIGAVASDLSGLSVTVGDQNASLTQLSKVVGSTGAVVVLDPSFELRDGSWTLGLNTSYTYSGNAARTGNYYIDYATGVGTRTSYNGGRFRVEAGQQIRLWQWLRYATAVPLGVGPTIGVRFYNEAGVDLSANQNIGAFPLGSLTTSFQKHEGVITVPANAAYGEVYVAGRHTSPANARVLVDDVGAEFVTNGESRFLASHTVSLDVNGNVSGTVSENDGVTSSFSILATIFRVISSGSTGLEWRDGYLRAYAGAIQLIFGINFGASSNLCFWYGPNVGANNCTKANATIWFDNAGSAYFGGSLSAGVLKNAAQSTQVSGTVTVETGTFATNGNQKSVIGSLTYGQNAVSSTVPWTGGGQSQTVSARLRVQRSYNGGAWTTIGNQTITGTRSYEAEGGSYRGFISLSGSVTLTDTQAGTANFAYRTIIDQPVNWPVALGSSPGSQNTTIMSVEE